MSTPFSGTFDGCGYTISNYTLRSGVSCGLWSYNSGTISNLKISNFNITIKSNVYGSYLGSLVGYNSGIIRNCCITDSNIEVRETLIGNSACAAGGLVGRNKGQIISSYSEANVTVKAYVNRSTGVNGGGDYYAYAYSSAGGIAANNGGTIENCYSTGIVYASSTSIINNYSSSLVEATEAYSGGLAGANKAGYVPNSDYTYGTILNSFSVSTVTASSTTNRNYVGAITGVNYGGTDCVINTYKIATTGTGLTTTLSNLKNEEYLKNTIGFGKYVSIADLQINPNNVWIFVEGEFPKLYWQVD